MSLKEGCLLKNRYTILEQLFTRPHKRVYMALDGEHENRFVAIKEIKQTLLDDDWEPGEIPALIAAIEREPVLLASLSHPQIPRYYEHFEQDDAWYLVMELVDGDELRPWLSKMLPGENLWQAPSDQRIKKVLAVAIQLCEVLDYLHTHDPVIFHRDIKPSNVLVTPQGEVMLIDFGISCSLARFETGKTSWGLTWGYAAPEQERDEWSTAQTDIYNLGITLSCLLSGRHSPKNAASHPFVPPDTIRPEKLHNLLTQMTQQDPEKRPATARYLGTTFRELLTELQGGPATSEQIRQMLASPSATYQTKGKSETCYQGQTVWYQFRLPTRRTGRLDIPAKITSIRSQSYGPDVEVTFVNPRSSVKERRWLHPSHLWKLSATARVEERSGGGFACPTQTAEGFEAIYNLGHDAATEIYRVSILRGAPRIYQNQATLDAAALLAASQYREQRQASVPNFTDDDQRFDAAWAAGYVVATLAEQDTYQSCPQGYLTELQERYASPLPEARVIDAFCSPVQARDGKR